MYSSESLLKHLVLSVRLKHLQVTAVSETLIKKNSCDYVFDGQCYIVIECIVVKSPEIMFSGL